MLVSLLLSGRFHGQTGWVHPALRAETLHAARLRAFVSLRLTTAACALACLPVALVFSDSSYRADILALAFAIGPLLVGLFVALTGRLEQGMAAHALLFSASLATLASFSGGVSSFALLWLATVPGETALLLPARRPIMVAVGAVLVALLWVAALSLTDALPPTFAHGHLLPLVSMLLALVYGLTLAAVRGHIARAPGEDRVRGEQLYRMLARHMSDLITRHGRTGQVTFASPASTDLLGVPPETLYGYGLFDRVHVADRPSYLHAIAEAAEHGRETSIEFRLRCAREDEAPSFVWLEMRCSPLSDEPGQAVVCVLRDISQRKEQEAALEVARAETDRANESRNRFLANVSHELRTPLNAIIGFSDMLKQEELLRVTPEKRREYAGLIHEAGEHLLNLVNSILDMSKIEAGHFEIVPESFDLAALLQNCAQIIDLRAKEAGLTVSLRLPETLPALKADKRACKQIMLNLLSNAVKFTDRGGVVMLTAFVQGEDMVIEVADSGVGIAPADLERLGEPFFQARAAYNRPYEGTGLGVSVVKGLAELQAGAVRFASREGKGTTVSVRLPLDVEARLNNRIEVLPLTPRSSQTIRKSA